MPSTVTGGQDTVGTRSRYPSARQTARRRFAASGGLRRNVLLPSANRFGRISPTTAAHVPEELGDHVPMILDGGACAVGIESTIVDCSRGEPVVLRPGHISPLHLEAVLGRLPDIATAVGAPRVSGSLAAHCAPMTPMRH